MITEAIILLCLKRGHVVRKSFVTGLIILLPLAVTIALIAFAINFITSPFVGFLEHFLLDIPFYIHHQAFVHFFLKIFSLFGLFILTIALGFLARVVFFKSVLSLYDYILHRIPVISTIYKTSQQVIKTIFGGGSKAFKQVVMAPFPHKNSYCLGLVSGQVPPVCANSAQSSMVSVFIPTTPNPTSGFLIMFDEKDLIYIDMKVDDAIKYVISCGVVNQNELE
ncbi:MAG: DUF502 domain-containing protein [Verrucomicrobia bacterium]|nr:DUF502 domain-containing protein [Verrucomicrobiota bacterium]MBS0646458.1 DUF502 domain-containing protein [Verrucomicrobiota bacterium]